MESSGAVVGTGGAKKPGQATFSGHPGPFLRRASNNDSCLVDPWEGEGVERRANGVWFIVDDKSERRSARLSGLARSSNHINKTDRKDRMDQLPATRREMLECKTCPRFSRREMLPKRFLARLVGQPIRMFHDCIGVNMRAGSCSHHCLPPIRAAPDVRRTRQSNLRPLQRRRA